MKKLLRIAFIGCLHTTVYLWLIPVVILPRFGSRGSKITIACVVTFSIVFLTITFGRKRKKLPPPPDLQQRVNPNPPQGDRR